MKDLADIQKMRYDRGCVVYNTNNHTYGIVLNGECGVFNPVLLECLQDTAELLKNEYK